MNGVTIFWRDFAPNCSAVASLFLYEKQIEIIPGVAYD